MSELLRAPAPELTRRLRRLPLEFVEHDFLEAAMAASAYVALADGVLHPAEQDVTAVVRERVGALDALDEGRAGELYRAFLAVLRGSPAGGRARVMSAVRRLAGDAEAGLLLVQVCLAVAVADRSVSQAEYAAIGELCASLGLDLGELEA